MFGSWVVSGQSGGKAMQVKEIVRSRTPGKTAKKRASSATLADLAKREMPKWRVVEGSAQDAPDRIEVDAVSPKIGGIGARTASHQTRGRRSKLAENVADSASESSREKKTGLINMVPESQQDARLGSKTQVFEDGEHTGSQG